MIKRQVPELSLLSYVNGSSTEQAKFVDSLMYGLKDYGFITLVDHTVDSKLCKKAYDVVHEFFQQPTSYKEKFVCLEGGGQRGFTAFGKEHAKDSKFPDLKEFWHVGRQVSDEHKFRKYYPKNVWPEGMPEFKEVLSKLYNSLDQTSVILLEAIGKGLDVPEGYFKEMVTLGNSILRPIHYPPTKNAPMGSVRAAAHEDINLITILMGATTSGLELLDHDGTWLPVETREGELIVDTGDMMEVITNGVLKATTHRVVNPDDSGTTRYSMPFFVHPHPETLLDPLASCRAGGLKYQPINSHEFLLQRIREIGLMKA
ncbi:MAG: isopenicillin N synthase family oxygenase [Bacteriovoracaceae bacterium]|nr:isopenicillin N synthase family oxygenase [Bacteriovoracaceae bacterium]